MGGGQVGRDELLLGLKILQDSWLINGKHLPSGT